MARCRLRAFVPYGMAAGAFWLRAMWPYAHRVQGVRRY
ncbi:Zn-dependent hydrolase [Acetobacter orientalis]|uniref:Zn-dependent hydrolase n=1 Tax=Acetobacter orientalis TaxID=146474 RepID=A0A2Z5ZK30_9PROT|nr:Zn-dependent hydrolase [Acetobacter orientalis]